jgi:hypothetical protein
MTEYHHTPQPAPRVHCLAYASLLPLLSLGKLDQDERVAVASHVATCVNCRRVLRDFDRLRDALHREHARETEEESQFEPLTLLEVRQAADREGAELLVFATPAPWQAPPISQTLRQRFSLMGVIEALAAVLVIALLGGLLVSRQHASSGAVATTLDRTSQAYVDLLRAYYVPLAQANATAQFCVGSTGNTLPAADRLGVMQTCRTPLTGELLAARNLSDQLAQATPPTRWREPHAALRRATEQLIPVLVTQLAAIDAQNVAQFLGTEDPASAAIVVFQEPINQINAQIHASPPPGPAPLLLMDWYWD